MYKVSGVFQKQDCDNDPKHTEREVFQVQDLLTQQHLLLCPKCFLANVRLRSKGKNREEEDDEPQLPFAEAK